MDNSQNTSSSMSQIPQQQHHYAILLSTVAELKSDLEKTMTKIQQLEDQNLSLKDNCQSLKDVISRIILQKYYDNIDFIGVGCH